MASSSLKLEYGTAADCETRRPFSSQWNVRLFSAGCQALGGKAATALAMNTPVNATNEKSEEISFVMTPSVRETVHKNRSSERPL
jgi:hypothetical protein